MIKDNRVYTTNVGDEAVVRLEGDGTRKGQVELVSLRGINIFTPNQGSKFFKWSNVQMVCKKPKLLSSR